MNTRILAVFFSALLWIAACSRSEPPKPVPVPDAKPAPAPAQPSFINTVWAVAESKQVETGSLRVFLSEGTLVMASPHAKPALGTWSYIDGRLKIVEEGQPYDVDILDLTTSAFRIRIHNPGEPVEILFTPAEPVASLGARVEEQVVDDEPTMSLWGTAWRLDNASGATLGFPSEGRASGSGSCNRFNGVVTIDGDAISFGGIAATRKACTDAVMRQEDAYFAALRDAERFEADEQTLRLYVAGRPEPLRFVATQANARAPEKPISRASSARIPAMTGIWTIVGYRAPGVGAASEEEIGRRVGESVRLTAVAATSSTGRCDDPVYAASQVSTEAYLASQFKPAREVLKAFVTPNELKLMDVSCNGAPWAALGGQLLEIDANSALTSWNGIFYELRRDRDFRAVGQEPGWQLEIRKGAEMRFTYDYGKGTAVTPAPAVQTNSGNGNRTYHARTESNDLQVVIVPVSCADSMSGKRFPATVSVSLNGKTYRGCGEELATPFQG